MSDYISEVNLVLILKFLPVKSLLQFRSVCKGWKQLIDSPAFVLHHLSVRSPTFIVQNGRGRRFFVVDLLHRPRHSVKPLNKPIPRMEFYLCGTLHGIVCLYDLLQVFLWNPSIRKVSRIDRPKGLLSLDAFVFDRLQVTYGFWINPSTKEFKIIFLQRFPAMVCYLYSSIRGDWSVIPTPTKVENWRSCKDGPPVMIGDVAHWGGCLDESVEVYHWDHDHHRDKAILSFSFAQECFETIELCNPANYSKNEPGSRGDFSLDDFYDTVPLYYTAPFRWKDTLSFLSWSNEFPFRCKIFLRKENSWVGMFDFRVWENFDHVFWAMEGLKEVKKRGKSKRKREIEASDSDSAGAQDNVTVLATTATDRKNWIGALVLKGTRPGTKYVKNGLDDYTDVLLAYDFVESLLFP